MGFIRKAAIVSTGGVARVAINPNSKKARTAKATEKMLKVQQAEARAAQAQRLAAGQPTVTERQPAVGWKESQLAFHTKEADKYETRAEKREAKGKTAAAARARKIADRSRRKAAAYESALAERPSDVDMGSGAPGIDGAQAAPSGDLATQLATLGDLHASGVLSDDEFAAAKARLLN